MHKVFIVIVISFSSVLSITQPSLYQCRAVRLLQEKEGTNYSKGYQTQSLYVKIDRNEIRVFGIHSKISICKKFKIKRIYADTVYVENPEDIKITHDDLKLYLNVDTLVGNINLFDDGMSKVTIKILVKKIVPHLQADLERRCCE